MTRELFNLAELLAAAGIGVCVGGVVVFLATVWMRNDAAADRIVAADDLAKVAAGVVRMESARQLLPLHPAYQAHTAQFEMIRAEPEPDASVEQPDTCGDTGHVHIGPYCTSVEDQPAPTRRRRQDANGVIWTQHPSGCWVIEDDPDSYRRLIDTETDETIEDFGPLTELEPAPAYTDDELTDDQVSTALVLVDEPPVTADDLAPIGPDHMPRLTFWGRVALGAALLPLLVALVLLALAVLARVGWDRAGEWRAGRRRRRETETVLMELAHPAPADAYEPRHLAPAGRWWWSR